MSNKYSNSLAKVVKAISVCDTLPRHRFVVDFKSVNYYPDSDMLTMMELDVLSSIAVLHKLHYYVTTDSNGLCFRMYIPRLIF